MDKLFEIRETYPRDVKKEVRLYTLDRWGEGSEVIGSLSYHTTNASDVDMFERVYKPDLSQLISFTVRNIQRIVATLKARKDNYFLEFKAGLDTRWMFPIGISRHNVWYPPSTLWQELMVLPWSSEERVRLATLSEAPRDQKSYEELSMMLRRHYILRWTSQEVAQGYKIVAGKQYSLEEAVQAESNINIEGIFIRDDNTYSEVSNFFVLEYEDSVGKRWFLNLSQRALTHPKEYREENLKQSMYALMYSQVAPSLFKAVKRMFSFGRAFRDEVLLTKAYQIVNTPLGLMYTLTSQLKTIAKLCEIKDEYIYKNVLYHHLEQIRFRLDELITIDYDFTPLLQLIEVAIHRRNTIKQTEVAKLLNELTKDMVAYINIKTLPLMKQYHLYPLPPSLVPLNPPF